MKRIILILFSLISVVSGVGAQNTVKMTAIKANDYGVAYALPKTEIVITAYYTRTTRKVGEYYQYAERYLSIPNVISENETIYTLDKVDVSTRGIPDKDKSYLVEFKSGSTAPFVTLTQDGLICAINDDYKFSSAEAVSSLNKDLSAASSLNPRNLLSEEILRAGSTAKQAELIAKQIYRLRESRTNILTGDADNMPPDGNAYKLVMSQLEEQDKALTAMFTGTESVQKGVKTFKIVPDDRNINNRILFRFSTKLGIVDENDLGGAPVSLYLKNKMPIPEQILTPKEQQQMDKKFSQGIIYNIPGKGIVDLTYNGQSLLSKEYDIVQYGTQDVLIPKMFENNKQPIKVIFYPDLGAIKQIIQ